MSSLSPEAAGALQDYIAAMKGGDAEKGFNSLLRFHIIIENDRGVEKSSAREVLRSLGDALADPRNLYPLIIDAYIAGADLDKLIGLNAVQIAKAKSGLKLGNTRKTEYKLSWRRAVDRWLTLELSRSNLTSKALALQFREQNLAVRAPNVDGLSRYISDRRRSLEGPPSG